MNVQGRAPHKFTPVPGVHESLKPTRNKPGLSWQRLVAGRLTAVDVPSNINLPNRPVNVYNMGDYTHRRQEMRTNVVLDDDLMESALKASGLKTKKDAIEEGLKLLVQLKGQKEIKGFRGKLKRIGWILHLEIPPS